MIRLRLLFGAVLMIVLTACAAPAAQPTTTPEPPSQLPPTQPIETPLPPDLDLGTSPLPQPGDKKLQRGEVFIDQSQLLTAESFPPQFFLSLSGSLPTPCHQLRVTTNLDSNQRMVVTAYSLSDPQAVCVQVLEPFTVSLPLGSLATGQYEVWVNGQPVGEIETP